MGPILTHLMAALALPILWLGWRGFTAVRRERQFVADFWRRQTVESIQESRVLGASPLPPLLGVVEAHWAANGTMEALALCIESGLFRHLHRSQGATVEEMAEFIDLPIRLIRASVEVMMAAGVLHREDSRYGLTAAGRLYLLEDSPLFDSWLPPLVPARRMLASLRSRVLRRSAEKWSAGQGHQQQRWAIGMHRISFPLGFALHRSGLVADGSQVLDVAGGAGSVCIALALENPTLQLQMLELAGSVAVAERLISQYQVASRVQCVVSDMFHNEWPANVDVVLFTNIFHDWDDEKCRVLARNAFAALRPGGRIILQEALLHDEKPGPLWTAQFSVTMALGMHGRQFRGLELISMLRDAGFDEIGIQPLLGYYSAIVGSRPA